MSRKHLDAYQTPAALTKVLLEYINPYYTDLILEPCSGNGAIAAALRKDAQEKGHYRFVLENDIDSDIDGVLHHDAADPNAEMWTVGFGPHVTNWKRWAWTITNPPYLHQNEIVHNALRHSDNVAMLLRVSFLEPTKNRKKFLEAYAEKMTKLIVFSGPRPSFTDDGRTDSVTTAWFVWRNIHNDEAVVEGIEYIPVTGWKESGD